MATFDGKRVLFLCVANSARSPMAAGLAPRFLPGVIASSAGARPIDEVHPYAVEVMRDAGIDVSGHRPRSVDEVDPGEVDLVVSLTEEEVRSPALMDKPFVGLRIADPAIHAMEFSRSMAVETFRAVREDIEDALRDLANRP